MRGGALLAVLWGACVADADAACTPASFASGSTAITCATQGEATAAIAGAAQERCNQNSSATVVFSAGTVTVVSTGSPKYVKRDAIVCKTPAGTGTVNMLATAYFTTLTTCSTDSPSLTSSAGWVGAPSGTKCSGNCQYTYEPCNGLSCDLQIQGATWHYGIYKPTGQVCVPTIQDPPVPEISDNKCEDLGGGMEICQDGPSDPPCIITAEGKRHCIYPPGPICRGNSDNSDICIGNPNPDPVPGPNEGARDPETCGTVNGRRVCYFPEPEVEEEEEEEEDPECPESDPECEEDEEENTASDAPCEIYPSCEGDPILCLQLMKQHRINCEVKHSNVLLAEFRDKQLEEVRETNAKIAKLNEIADRSSDALEKMDEEIVAEIQETNGRIANMHAEHLVEVQRTNARLQTLNTLGQESNNLLEDLNADLTQEIDDTNDILASLAAQYGDQEAILELIRSDTDRSADNLDIMSRRGEGWSVPSSCSATMSCPMNNAECQQAQAAWGAACVADHNADARMEELLAQLVLAEEGIVGAIEEHATDTTPIETGLDDVVAAIGAIPAPGDVSVEVDQSGVISAVNAVRDQVTRGTIAGGGTCGSEPACVGGDPVACYSAYIAWRDLCDTEEATLLGEIGDAVDRVGDLLEGEPGDGDGVDAPDFEGGVEVEDTNALMDLLDLSGFLSDRTCPVFPVVTVMDTPLDLNAGTAWCDFLLLGRFMLVAAAWFIVGKILAGGE